LRAALKTDNSFLRFRKAFFYQGLAGGAGVQPRLLLTVRDYLSNRRRL
jgi:hypothetical protein